MSDPIQRIVALYRDNIDPRVAKAQPGCARSTDRIDPDRLFVAPMFMAISRKTWDALGRPRFRHDAQNDVAQRLNEVARANNVAIEMLFPWGAIMPKRRLGDICLYRIGAFYRGGVFHLSLNTRDDQKWARRFARWRKTIWRRPWLKRLEFDA